MTQNERKLTIVFGGVLAVFMVYLIVAQLLIGPIRTLRADITNMQADCQRLETQARAEGTYRRLWTQLASRTLSGDKGIAAGKLDHLVKDLLTESGLQHFTVNPGDIKPSKDKLYAVLPYTVVGAEGEMQAFAKFLHRFYQQPYAMQITGFNVEPVTFRKGGTLRVSSLVIEALVLPTDDLPTSLAAAAQATATSPAATRPTVTNAASTRPAMMGPATQPVAPGSSPAMLVNAALPSPASAPAPLVPGRPKEANLLSYAVVWEKKFMEAWTNPPPPPPPPPPPAVPQQATAAMPMISPGGGLFTGPTDIRITCSTPGATIHYTTDGTEPSATTGQVYDDPIHLEAPGMIKAIASVADKRPSGVAVASFTEPPPPPMKLIVLAMSGDTHEAVLLNEQTKERQVIQEGESLDGGTLLCVLSDAAIVEMPEGARYIYWLGKGFRDKEILDENRQPEVWTEVKELEESKQQ